MKDYRPLLVDVGNLLDEIASKIEGPSDNQYIDDHLSFSREEILTLLESVNEMFDDLDA